MPQISSEANLPKLIAVGSSLSLINLSCSFHELLRNYDRFRSMSLQNKNVRKIYAIYSIISFEFSALSIELLFIIM